MASMQDVLDYARLTVNDTASDRYKDVVGIKYANYGCARALELRPDLRMGTGTGLVSGGFGYGPWVDLTTTSSFPLPREYAEKIGSFVVFGWQSSDDQFVNDQTAAAGYTLFLKELLGV